MNRNDLIKKLTDRKLADGDANRTICGCHAAPGPNRTFCMPSPRTPAKTATRRK